MNAGTTLVQNNTTANNSKNIRFIDSLRGLSALWVVLGHARRELEGIHKYDANSWLYFLTYVKEEFAVAIFIILSGFLLAYPYINWDWQKWQGGIHFMKRRMLRIYPAYIATILIIYGCSFFIPALSSQATPRWALAVPIDGSTILTHLFMVHNYFPSHTLKIDPPMWSLAIEWQIYLCFAFITMPLGVRFGPRAFFLGLWAIIGILSLSHGYINYFAAAFCLGVAVAWFIFNRRIHLDRKSMWMISLTAIFIVVLCAMGSIKSSRHMLMFEISFALALIVLLQYKDNDFKKLPVALKILDSKSLRLTGWFSYSLYLVHYPILSLFGYLCVTNNLNSAYSGFAISISVLFSLAFALLYAIVFEHRKLPANL